jgi:hypothetical protein
MKGEGEGEINIGINNGKRELEEAQKARRESVDQQAVMKLNSLIDKKEEET